MTRSREPPATWIFLVTDEEAMDRQSTGVGHRLVSDKPRRWIVGRVRLWLTRPTRKSLTLLGPTDAHVQLFDER